MTIDNHALSQPGIEMPRPSRLARSILFLMPVLAGLGPFASITPGAAGAPYAYRILIAAAALPALAKLIQNRERDPRTTALLVTTVAFLLWGSLALGWTPNTDRGGRQLAGILISLLGCWVAIGLSGRHPAGLAALRGGFVLAAVVLSSVGIWQYVTGENLWTITGQPFNFTGNPLLATFINPNNYAAFLLGCLGPILATAIAGTRRHRALGISVILLFGWIMFHTESRTGLFGLLLIALVACVVVGVKLPKTQTPLLLGGMTAGVIGLVNLRRMDAFFDGVNAGTSASDDLRIQLSKIAWQYFVESHGIGIGPAGFEIKLGNDSAVDALRVLPPHNTFLEIASEYGLPVLIPFMALMVSLLISGFGRRASGLARTSVADRVDLLACVVAIIAGGLVASTLIADPGWWLLITYSILLTRQRLSHVHAPQDQGETEVPRLTTSRTQ